MAADFESNFFTLLELLDQGSRLEVEGVCTKITVPPNEVLYKQGDPSNSVYIVSSGRVEAFTQSPDGRMTRSIGFMGKGEFFGDLGVLTNHERLGSIRTCEPSKLLQIEKLAFVRMLEKVPKMGAYFSRNLARRLHYTSTQAHVNVYSVDLAGNLQHFDMLTIFQPIIGRQRSGELHLHNAGNEIVGSFFFRLGRIERARYFHLVGAEALWQAFVPASSEGTFIFRAMDEPAMQFADETRIEIEGPDLLKYGAACHEAIGALPENLRLMNGRLNRVAESLSWTDEGTQPLADRIWELIAKRPQTLDSLWRRLNVSSLSFLQTVSVLVDTAQAEVLPVETAPPP
jgi:CRP-like cAMP-binding protein